MDILTALKEKSDYTTTQLQMIFGAWVLSGLFEKNGSKVSATNGDVEEEDYDKKSVYSLLYSLYRSMGIVKSETGEPYEFTFNTWGYAWPKSWGPSPILATDPQRFGRNAYSGLFEFPQVKKYVAERDGKVHVVEMGCGTGAGANHVTMNVLPQCTYEAVDMQQTAILTCQRRFVPQAKGRLVATCADCTQVPIADAVADIVVVNETHVTEHTGKVSAEDKLFLGQIQRILKPGGLFVWGNAIPDDTWQPCFDHLASLGIKKVEERDVTLEAIQARDEDAGRADAYVEQCVEKFWGFRIPHLGQKRRFDAEIALKNFFRQPGTNLYERMVDRTDTYKVVLLQKEG
jgi:ubiquinone/menaquinone biosynthesis C-methylase UbiE